MRRFIGVALGLVCVAVCSCGRRSPQEPVIESLLQVYVHSEDIALAEKRIGVLELGVEKQTDTTGIAEFPAPAGDYTVRAYGISTPGPPPMYVDIKVTTARGETTRVDVLDCLPCVAPNEVDEKVAAAMM